MKPIPGKESDKTRGDGDVRKFYFERDPRVDRPLIGFVNLKDPDYFHGAKWATKQKSQNFQT